MSDREIITPPRTGRAMTDEERAAVQAEIDAVMAEAAHAVNRYRGFELAKPCESHPGPEKETV